VVASLEQSWPLRSEWLNFSRLRLRAESPLQLGPVVLHTRAKGGYIYGDLPPYEAFPIGGTNSVRAPARLPDCLPACLPAGRALQPAASPPPALHAPQPPPLNAHRLPPLPPPS
jgi:hypothetical protein